MIYVISDIHGCLERFKAMLSLIRFTGGDTMYVIGDMIDRGEDPIGVVRYVMNHDNIHASMGNHEQFMIKADSTIIADPLSDWQLNGGISTINQLSKMTGTVRKIVFQYLQRLPYVFTILMPNDKVFKLVHAGLEINNDGTIKKKQDTNFMTWARHSYMFNQSKKHKEIIVSGHAPTFFIENIKPEDAQIINRGNRIYIDCGCAYKGKLSCLCLNNMREFYV